MPRVSIQTVEACAEAAFVGAIGCRLAPLTIVNAGQEDEALLIGREAVIIMRGIFTPPDQPLRAVPAEPAPGWEVWVVNHYDPGDRDTPPYWQPYADSCWPNHAMAVQRALLLYLEDLVANAIQAHEMAAVVAEVLEPEPEIPRQHPSYRDSFGDNADGYWD